MAYYPIVRKHDRPAAAAGHQLLPTFYMNDFSVIGLRVKDCERAVRMLDQHAFSLKQVEGTLLVKIETASRMHRAMQLLNAEGLECEIADIAETMYQG
jgi:hypothetical protein